MEFLSRNFMFSIVILTLSMQAGAAVSSISGPVVNKCNPRDVQQKQIKFKSLEYSVKESEVDFARVDQNYQAQLAKSIDRSVGNMKKAGISDKKTLQKYRDLESALRNFQERPDDELESTVSENYFQFINQLNANPDFSISMVNANYVWLKELKKEQALWQKSFATKSKVFADYVEAINGYHQLQKTCKLGKYQASN
ncbi:MAG: hypothetical protein ACAH59_01050 [Pseudobdellovibrionaceae bacterium]